MTKYSDGKAALEAVTAFLSTSEFIFLSINREHLYDILMVRFPL